jgi:hypothetical protein
MGRPSFEGRPSHFPFSVEEKDKQGYRSSRLIVTKWAGEIPRSERNEFDVPRSQRDGLAHIDRSKPSVTPPD